MLKEVKKDTAVNFKLLHRMIDYQLFDIDRGTINTMQELEVYAENTRSLMLYINLHLLRIDDTRANLIASHLGRAIGICDILKKAPYFIAVNRGYLPVDVMMKHNVQNDKIYRRQDTESIVAEEFYDMVLEIASYAKKHLQIARTVIEKADSKEPVPEHMHRAFLLAQEVEYWLVLLEKKNFNVFDEEVRANSYVTVPYAMHTAAKAGKF